MSSVLSPPTKLLGSCCTARLIAVTIYQSFSVCCALLIFIIGGIRKWCVCVFVVPEISSWEAKNVEPTSTGLHGNCAIIFSFLAPCLLPMDILKESKYRRNLTGGL